MYSLPQSFHNKLNNFTPDFDFSRSRLCYCCWFPVFRVKNSQKMYLIIDSPGLTRFFLFPLFDSLWTSKQTKSVINLQFANGYHQSPHWIIKWIHIWINEQNFIQIRIRTQQQISNNNTQKLTEHLHREYVQIYRCVATR